MKKKIKLVINKASSFVAPLFNQPKKHLKTWLVIFLALTASLAAFFFLLSPRATEAAWWDETWLYRKAVQISNSNGADLTDFQVAITLDTVSLITAGKMQGDCDDLRITDQNGQILPHWIEENNPGCNNAATKVWVKIPTVHKGANATTVYAYYGNAQAENAENGDNVFEFFDDFSGSSLDTNKWTEEIRGSGGIVSVSNGEALLSPTPNTISSANLKSLSTFTNNIIIELRRKQATNTNYLDFSLASGSIVDTGGGTSSWWHTSAQSGYCWLYQPSTSDGIRRMPSSGSSVALDSGALNINTSSYAVHKMAYGSAGELLWVIDDIQKRSATDTNFLSNEKFILISQGEYTNGAGDTQYVDYVFVRQYATSDPIAGTPAAEEISPGPVAYWKFDEGTGTTAHDSSGQGNHGAITGATWQTEDMCISGKCLYFDSTANHYVRGNNNVLLNGDQTFSTWVYPTTTSGLRGVLTTHNHSSTSNIGLNQYNNRYSISIGYIDDTREYISKQSNHTITANQWDYVVLVYNLSANSVSLYVNGVFDKQWTLSKEVKFTSEKILVGQWSNTYLNNYKFDGNIDEPKIYPYARTADQIKSDYIAGASSKGSSAVFGHKTETAPITPLASKLVAYWKFDEGYGTTAHDSVGNNHGTLSGTTLPEWTNEGKIGKALSFNPNMANKIVSNLVYNNSSEYTLSGFIYPTQDGGSQWRIIIGTSKGNNIDAGVVLSGNDICYHDYVTSGDTNFCSIGNLVSLNQWHHFSLSYRANDIKLYLNGQEVATINETKNNTSAVALIGGANIDPYGGVRFFSGLIDEVKIYNYALTPEEVALDYNQGMAAVMGQSSANTGSSASAGSAAQEYCVPGSSDYCAPPVAEWNFEENQGATAHDTSGNGNDGTLVNMDNSNWVAGANGSGAALSFDGVTNYITVIDTTDSSLDASETMTIQARVKNQGEPSGMQSILRKEGAYALRYSSGNLNGIIWSGGSPKYTTSVVKGTSWDTEKWNHWSFVFTGSSLQMFKNGQKIVADNSFTGPIDTNNSTLGIAATGTGDHKFPGLIDQVRIYDYARTPAQIAWDYNRGGPVGHWRFDECEGTVAHDVSGNENHGTINIGATAPQTAVGTCQTPGTAWGNGAAGKLNSAMSFDGVDDWVDVGNNPSIANFTTNFTVSAWIYPNSSDAGGIVARNNRGSPWNHLIQMMGATSVRIRMWSNGTDAGTGVNYYFYPENLVGKWTHLLYTFDGAKVRAYVNGKEIDNWDRTDPIAYGERTIIGEYAGSTFDGLIDDVQIFNYALTPLQIKTLYNNGAVRFGE